MGCQTSIYDSGAKAGINVSAGSFSEWPKEAGLAATRDMDLIAEFARTMRSEWNSIGLRSMYGYMADLATEPRWFRIHETFTEDADLAADIMTTLIENLQGKEITNDSIVLTMKHFPGGGPQEGGGDAHYNFGKNQVYPADMFDYHVKPFKAAIDAGLTSVMPYYGMPVDQDYEPNDVGMSFSKGIITDLLRGELGFTGNVNSDTGIMTMTPWGVENKTIPERMEMSVKAGVDVLSGFNDNSVIIDLVENGKLSEERVNTSVKRLLTEQFELGLFENPYVDPDRASYLVGNRAYQRKAEEAQRKSIVMLENKDQILPIEQPSEAESWVVSPSLEDINQIMDEVGAENTILSIYFRQPFVIDKASGLRDAGALLATFGVRDAAVMNIITGNYIPQGKLPFASDTAGQNRWKSPQPVKSWSGVKKTTKWGDGAYQTPPSKPGESFYGTEFYYDDNYIPEFSENGLNLNIYTPAESPNVGLPVLYYIHGGGNNHGYNSKVEFEASKLAEKGIVVVEVQYRLGALGFLALEEAAAENEHGSTGNYAILDLIKGLEWVQDNINEFGGNPSEVTIAGQSAGAFNVTALLRSPLADGLYRAAIIQSGFDGLLTEPQKSRFMKYQTLDESIESGKKAIKEAFGKEMSLTELRELPVTAFVENKLDNGSDLLSSITNFTIDGYVFTEESIDLRKKGALDDIDIMIGGTSDEMTSLFGNPEGKMPVNNFEETIINQYGSKGLKAYNPESEKEAYKMNWRIMSDLAFQKYIISAKYAKENNENMNAYVYYFNHFPPGRNSDFYGAFHSSELWYSFYSLRNVEGQRNWTEKDHNLADEISSYFVNFIKTGNPNGADLANWNECSNKTGENFMHWHDGKSENALNTNYPLRDKVNKELVEKIYKINN
ncbi:Carboxylesterase type B [Halanaerobium kushneri]|uniref:Carboxylesterase type B n=1 Tax=Halanaerobium kushneri TaxID=56779 RepID=A0A1N6URL0_9FIRM|nr:carboxylesterase family protein [Halanaerobium kushneri]SIQ68274.1 Carboxylesterase type B [Halanaerobium kushneri]